MVLFIFCCTWVPPNQCCKYHQNRANHFAQEKEVMSEHQGIQSFSVTGQPSMFAVMMPKRYIILPCLSLLLFVSDER